MRLFTKQKKEETTYCCNNNCDDNKCIQKQSENSNMENIKILGSGCSKCNQLELNVCKALKQLNINTTIEHITDATQIASYGVMTTPALVINEKVASYGRVLSTDEAVKIMEQIM